MSHYGAEDAGPAALVREGEDADAFVAGYLEILWAAGAGIAAASNTVAGVAFLCPPLRKRLDLSWMLLRTWRKQEPAGRVLPLTPELVGAMAGLAIEAAAFDFACLLLVSFETMLRGGEAFNLRAADVHDRGTCMVLRIDSSKTTAGKDAAEAVVVRSAAGMRLLRLVVAGLEPSQTLTSRSPNQLRAGLQRLATALGFAGLFSWHSCRRGGASDMFCRTGSMEQTLVRGRWASTMTARIYIEDAVADLVKVRVGDAVCRDVQHGLMILRQFMK